jgi:hypothetical protein
VVVVTADRLANDVMEGDMWACGVRERASSLGMSAACVVASVMAMFDPPWYPSVPDVSSRLLSVSAALNWTWNVAHFFCVAVLARHSRVATSNLPVVATML